MNFKLQIIRAIIGILFSVGAASAQSIPVPTQRPPVTDAGQDKITTVKPQPEYTYQSACPVLMKGLVSGKIVAPIDDNGCGERSPIEINAIAGTDLSMPATLNCNMAVALVDWIEKAQEATAEINGSKISQILSSTSYQCRRRNNLPSGKISEHGFANALDITGFRLEDGTVISVQEDWQPVETPAARFLRKVHGKACESFTTVLGPDADPYHTDHFHFDLGCHGKTCTYLICE